MPTIENGNFAAFRDAMENADGSRFLILEETSTSVLIQLDGYILEISGTNLTYNSTGPAPAAGSAEAGPVIGLENLFSGGTVESITVYANGYNTGGYNAAATVSDLNMNATDVFSYINGINSVPGTPEANAPIMPTFADVYLSMDWTITNGYYGSVNAYDATGDFDVNGGILNDEIDTGSGNDTIFGGAGDDYIFAGAGNDTIFSGTGEYDVIYAEDGDDKIHLEAEDFDYKDVYGGEGYDAVFVGTEFSNISVSGSVNNDGISEIYMSTLGGGSVAGSQGADAAVPVGVSAYLENVEVVVFEDGLYSVAGGFISTRTVQEDTNDDFDWNTIVTDIDIFTPGLETTTTEYDNGVVRVTVANNGTPVSFTETDVNDRFAWDSRVAEFNPDGSMAYFSFTLDNGVNETTTVEADGSFTTVFTDTMDVKSWAGYAKTYDVNGVIVENTSYYDDGRVVEFLYENGVRSSRYVEDTADNFVWERHATTYDENGVQTGRVTQFDDGIVETTYMNASGVVTTRSLLDSADVDDWFQIISTYDDHGNLEGRVTQYDDGTEEVEFFGTLPPMLPA